MRRRVKIFVESGEAGIAARSVNAEVERWTKELEKRATSVIDRVDTKIVAVDPHTCYVMVTIQYIVA
ncbi:MAG: hypothetical protein G01um10143_710 [Parcubacteria group bacterium Gr01-1014_3]|nr:MAG: hypothetical protein G01um10143_710 [Parcubacteria group bacterium Gr01-1014_3]